MPKFIRNAKNFFLFQSVAIFLSLSGLFYTIFLIRYNNYYNFYKAHAEEDTANRLKSLKHSVNTIFSDLMILSESDELIEFSATERKHDKLKTTQTFLKFLRYKNIYDQIRYIDNTGLEKIRVNYNYGNSSIIETAKLQNKNQRYYFKESIKLNKNEIYISPIDLNIENEEIQIPLKPMLRIATVIFDKNQNKRGVLIINILADYILKDFDSNNKEDSDIHSLLNAEGYWLKSDLKENEWGFMYAEKKDLTFQNRFPKEWSEIISGKEGTIETENGIFVFIKIYPVQLMGDFSKNSAVFNDKKIENRLWYMISQVPDSKLNEKRKSIQHELIVIFLIVYIIILIFNYLMSKYKEKERLSEEDLKAAQLQLTQINLTFLTFTQNHEENINKITALAGELLEGVCALYNRISEGMLCSLGMWNAPADYNPYDKPDGHICYDVIKLKKDGVFLVQDLQKSIYAKTDPNVTAYKLETYAGHAIKRYDETIGSLCVVFQRNIQLTENQREILGILASAIGLEEERMKDDADLVNARMAAENANRAKSKFLANMSHEIRTPMNAIMGFTSILFEEIEDPEHKSYLNSVQLAGKTLLHLINDILDLSKIEAGAFHLENKAFNAHELFNEIKTIFSQKASEKNLDLLVNIDENLPEVIVHDEIRLRQVLLNLVSNAIKFTEKGYVRLSASKEIFENDNNRFNLKFSVEDTGIGIKEKDQKLIFDPFLQATDQSHSKYGGTGLGLSITKRLIEIMEGSIFLESAVDKGSIFSVTIKNIAAKVFESDEKEDKKTLKDLVFKKSKILIVDDVHESRAKIRGFLEKYNFEIYEAENGKEGVDFALEFRPDLIFIALKMQVIEEYVAVKILKENSKTKLIPIVVLIAPDMKNDEIEIKDICDGHLRKPIDKNELLKETAKFLAHRDDNENI
ncbi:MAG: ATP-binding protein [Spirochaetia bacterium]|nr:ATP-binding protein [Spirochaetia bacterium]